MKDSVTLATNVKALEEKRTRLWADLQSADEAHKQARSAVVQTGDQRALDTVTVTHSRVSALGDALSTLDAQLEDLREQLTRVKEQERREQILVEIHERETKREQARVDYLAARERGNAALQEPTQAMFDAQKRFNLQGREIKRLYAAVGKEYQLSDSFKVPELLPFGYDVDLAFMRVSNMEARKHEEESRAQQRERQRLRSVA